MKNKLVPPTSERHYSGHIATRPADLRIGMYVDLNCSWFQHPFAATSFKIKTEKQLKTLRNLNLSTVLVDPSLSDPQEEEAHRELAPHASESVTGPEEVSSPQEFFAADPPTPPAIIRYKESLHQAEALYRESLSQSAQALHDIGTGSEEGLNTAKIMVDSLADAILDDASSSAITSLLGTQDLANNNVLHGMNVAVLAMLLGKQFELPHQQTKMLGIAGLLHDIGDQKIPSPILKRQWRREHATDDMAYRHHVEIGISMLAKFPGLPETVLELVRQHHERIDGSGYPHRLRGIQLSLLSRIIMVVDEYDSLINAPDISSNLTPTEALSRLYVTGKTTFSEEVVVALIQILSVYPPGTVVELDDHSIGVVVSINLHARMRPLIVLYNPEIERQSPDIADLSLNNERSIVRSIPRSELSPQISVYLNLTRWTGYFIDTSMKVLQEHMGA